MADKNIIELADCLQEQFADFEEKLFQLITDESKELKREVKTASPQDTGEYAKGWTLKKKKSDHYCSYILHNKNKPQIVHLLEFGHIARDGSRVPPSHHVLQITDKFKNRLDKFTEDYFK